MIGNIVGALTGGGGGGLLGGLLGGGGGGGGGLLGGLLGGGGEGGLLGGLFGGEGLGEILGGLGNFASKLMDSPLGGILSMVIPGSGPVLAGVGALGGMFNESAADVGGGENYA